MTKYVATQDETGLWGVEDLQGGLLYESTFEHASVAEYVANRHSLNDDLEWDDIADAVAALEAQLSQPSAPAAPTGDGAVDVLPSPTFAEASLENYAQNALSVIHASAAFGLEREQANTILWLIELVQKLNAKLENEREAWIEVQRRVQDAKDEARWRTAERNELQAELDSVRSQLAAAQAALKPFDALWTDWLEYCHSDDQPYKNILEWLHNTHVVENVGKWIREAKEALQATVGEG